MATECRKKRCKSGMTKYYVILGALLLATSSIGFISGSVIGRATAPETQVTITKTIEVPSYEEASLPSIKEGTYFNVPLSHSLQKYIYEIYADENVPVSLIIVMIDHESGFNPEIISDTGDYGLMQINTINHEQLAEAYKTADMLDPYQNVFCGIKIISSYIHTYHNNNKALMAYNMGQYGAEKAWKNGIESTSYSESILTLMLQYEKEMEENKE